jgi:hypothetical protein
MNIGINPTRVTTEQEFKLGTRFQREDEDGTKEYVYVRANGAITGAGYACDITSSTGDAQMCSTATTAPGTGAGKQVGVALAAFADNEFGWLQVYGNTDAIRVAANAAAHTILNSTGTAGQLDDDATAGAEVIDGVVLHTANGGAAAVAAGFLNYPKVGRTL